MNEIEKLHAVHLEILNEFVRICDLLNIEYFLIAGTMLGAVRHQGFIPWDDDLDVGLTRENYDLLIAELPELLDEKFHYMTPKNTTGYATPFLKIMKKDTRLGEANVPSTLTNYGIFIDVFPYDNVPESRKSRFFHKIKTEILKRLVLVKCKYNVNPENSFAKKIVYGLMKVLVIFFSEEFLKRRLYVNSIKYNNERTEFVTNIGGSYGYDKEMIKTEWLTDLKAFQFNEFQYLGFKAYDPYLKGLYGDYMELPPIENRGNRHNYEFIEF